MPQRALAEFEEQGGEFLLLDGRKALAEMNPEYLKTLCAARRTCGGHHGWPRAYETDTRGLSYRGRVHTYANAANNYMLGPGISFDIFC